MVGETFDKFNKGTRIFTQGILEFIAAACHSECLARFSILFDFLPKGNVANRGISATPFSQNTFAIIHRSTFVILLSSTFCFPQNTFTYQKEFITEGILRKRCMSYVDSHPIFTIIRSDNIAKNGDILQKFSTKHFSGEICENPTRISAPLPKGWSDTGSLQVSFYFFRRERQSCSGYEVFFDKTPLMKIDATINQTRELNLTVTKLIEAPPSSLQMVPYPLFSDTNKAQVALIANSVFGKQLSIAEKFEIRKTYFAWHKFGKHINPEIADSHHEFLLWVGQPK